MDDLRVDFRTTWIIRTAEGYIGKYLFGEPLVQVPELTDCTSPPSTTVTASLQPTIKVAMTLTKRKCNVRLMATLPLYYVPGLQLTIFIVWIFGRTCP